MQRLVNEGAHYSFPTRAASAPCQPNERQA